MEEGFIDNSPEPVTCESKWGSKDCPNLPAFLVITQNQPGFGIMCEPHKTGFCGAAMSGPNFKVELYSLSRAKALQAWVDETYGRKDASR